MAANAAPQELSAVPYRSTKVIQLIRHGKGFHNDLPSQSMYQSWDYFDAHLTDLGWQQSEGVNAHVRKHELKAQLIVSSPLTRTLETAAGCFGGLTFGNDPKVHSINGNGNKSVADTNNNGHGRSAVFMNSTKAETGKSVKHGPIALPDIPVIAHELCRETLGVHPCDKRRTVTELKEQFPGVDFSHVEHDEDVLWKERERETSLEIRSRAYAFAQWLMTRRERHIAVVAHSGFLYAFCQNFGHGLSDTVNGLLHPHFANGEMRTIILTDTSGKLTPDLTHDPLHFPGGNHVLEMQTT